MENLIKETRTAINASQGALNFLLRMIRKKKQVRKYQMSMPEREVIGTIWHRTYNIMQHFNQEKLQITQSEILLLFQKADINPSKSFAIIPKIPSQPISLENVLLVDLPSFKFIMAKWKKNKNEEAYKTMLDEVHALNNPKRMNKIS